MKDQPPVLQDWLDDNPGKTTNDYFQVFTQAGRREKPMFYQQSRPAERSNNNLLIGAGIFMFLVVIGLIYWANIRKVGVIVPTNTTEALPTINDQQREELGIPSIYLDVEVVGYKSKLLEANEIETVIRNRAQSVKYSNIEMEIKWVNQSGAELRTEKITCNQIIFPGDQKSFTINRDGPIGYSQYFIYVTDAKGQLTK